MGQFADMIDEASAKLFAPFAAPDRWRAAEKHEGFGDLWAAIEGSGFLDLLSTEDEDPAETGAAAFCLIRNAGRALLPAPLGETMLARIVLREAGLAVPDGPLVLSSLRAPYGRYAKAGVQMSPSLTFLMTVTGQEAASVNAAGEPRDTLNWLQAGNAPNAWAMRAVLAAGALIRAAQMAGAIERILMLTADYARTRNQFGKPIGQFQAIQQQLAVLAGQAASASVAAAHAFRQWRHQDFVMLAAAAKIRAGEAAGAAISIAHQTHGAIGITHEHELHFATRRLHSWRTESGGEARWAQSLGAWAAKLGPDEVWARITMS
jgi:acyl-CoA dehydrogenase